MLFESASYLKPKTNVMKKLFVFLGIISFLIFAYIKTEGFTHLGAKLSYSASAVFQMLALLLLVVSFLYMAAETVEKYAQNQSVTPFRSDEE